MEPAPATASTPEAVRAAVAGVALWYHTLELPHGVITPGWFDLRAVAATFPWPDVRGRRCLDVGTYDGFLAFELERRGAREVVATDVADHDLWDWPVRLRARGPEQLAAMAGPEKGRGFTCARDALGSAVERVEVSVYDLSPERLGEFDVVVCGSLMLHLRDPLRALAAIRSVCAADGELLSSEVVTIDPLLRRTPRALLELDGLSDVVHWSIPNPAGHVRMVETAGFAVVSRPLLYAEPLGPGHAWVGGREAVWPRLRRRLAGLGPGVPHQVLRARAE